MAIQENSEAVAEDIAEEKLETPSQRLQEAGNDRRLIEGLAEVAKLELLTRIGEQANREGNLHLVKHIEHLLQRAKEEAEGSKHIIGFYANEEFDNAVLMAAEQLSPESAKKLELISFLVERKGKIQRQTASDHQGKVRKKEQLKKYDGAIGRIDNKEGMLASLRAWFKT